MPSQRPVQDTTPGQQITALPRAAASEAGVLSRAAERTAARAGRGSGSADARSDGAPGTVQTPVPPASPTSPQAAAAGNPLAGRPWGVYKGSQDMAWEPYVRATGETKRTLGVIALAPKAKWFGHWIPDSQIADRVRDYIDNAQAGDPETLVQMTIFRMVPWELETCKRLPTQAERASYRRWTDAFASAVGDAHTAIVLQPDGPFALCAPGGSKVPSRLIAYTARVLSGLPHTSVYIEAGAADWPSEGQGGVAKVLDFLIPGGIQYARGISLNGTHYSATSDEIRRGAAIVEALAQRGITGKHVVINTSGNGQPFKFGTYTGPDPLNAQTCRSDTDPRTCVALGIPPTTDVANARWGLPTDVAALAREYVDGYVWFGRPWLYRQNSPFVMQRALAVVRNSPYFD
ncbi:glycoside hydrolase family 6 protein [Nocardioides sp. Leaf285]|uniref:glycoside hydrolase family 6 protein n=1 Tax=Nocardioides sp. Leaf285 TaxID=1736322 RepID=UPI001F19FBA6|nr:glycoside hydrolase family 6 protein [Nocardioides sp. Leaf285]